MWMDIVDVQRFYASNLGQVAKQSIRRHIRMIWPDVRNLRVLSLGYAAPYLDLFMDEADCLFAAMPAGQGTFSMNGESSDEKSPWSVFLTDETSLPLPDRSIDRLLLVHCLEASSQVCPMMRELWRVLADGGRLLIIVPNRHSLWAQVERTPFAHGSPYSIRQLHSLLNETLYSLEHSASALFLPPLGQGGLQRTFGRLDDLGTRWLPHLGGVLLADTVKQIYTATPLMVRRRRNAYLPLPHNRMLERRPNPDR